MRQIGLPVRAQQPAVETLLIVRSCRLWVENTDENKAEVIENQFQALLIF